MLSCFVILCFKVVYEYKEFQFSGEPSLQETCAFTEDDDERYYGKGDILSDLIHKHLA